VQCTRATRRVSIAKPATAAAPSLAVWTSSLTRSVPASFNPATGRLTIELAASDPLLDALSNSRGRLGFTVGSEPSLIVPAWAEPARVVEDCRA
jgi:DNA-binding transcriptional LysR family regulator